MRCLAAVLVAVHHLSWHHPGAEVTLDAGWVGAEIFFAISGFGIAGSAHGASPIEFAERRFARLYPAAIACALIDRGPAHRRARRAGIRLVGAVRPRRLPVLDRMLGGPFQVSALHLIPFALHMYGLTALPVDPFRSTAFYMTLLRHGCFFALGILIWLSLAQPYSRARTVAALLAVALCCIEIVARAKQIERS